MSGKFVLSDGKEKSRFLRNFEEHSAGSDFPQEQCTKIGNCNTGIKNTVFST
jgi:hypothetical protein